MKNLNNQQLATILAALRYYQANGQGDPAFRSGDIHDIATDGGEVISLDETGIDQLCEQLRSGTPQASNNPDLLECLWRTDAVEIDGCFIRHISVASPEDLANDEDDSVLYAAMVDEDLDSYEFDFDLAAIESAEFNQETHCWLVDGCEVNLYALQTIEPSPNNAQHEHEMLGEDEATRFLSQRIEEGDIDLEDIPLRMARYGLMDPESFSAEMAERMALANEE